MRRKKVLLTQKQALMLIIKDNGYCSIYMCNDTECPLSHKACKGIKAKKKYRLALEKYEKLYGVSDIVEELI